ncbi:MAG: lactonase family protein [Deltaproteobacteria bacterium]
MANEKQGTGTGTVYSMTNASPINEVIAFRRDTNGKLTFLRAFETGGSGTGQAMVDPLSSQGSVILSDNGSFLFAVNAGSNSISSFRVKQDGQLKLENVEPSGGIKPNSLTMHGNLLYVTNAGNMTGGAASNVTGFYIDKNGNLTMITGAMKPLSSSTAQPACVVFDPSGSQIVVSELNTNKLSVYQVHQDGSLSGPTVNKSNGPGPFGSVFLSNGVLLVTEAGDNALSSYTLDRDGKLAVVSGSILNAQSATCWVTVYDSFAYTSNAGSNTLSPYRIKNKERLSLLRIKYSTIQSVAAPLDSAASEDGHNLYVLNGNQGSITVFRIGKDGQLARLQVFKNTGLPTLGAQGLALR